MAPVVVISERRGRLLLTTASNPLYSWLSYIPHSFASRLFANERVLYLCSVSLVPPGASPPSSAYHNVPKPDYIAYPSVFDFGNNPRAPSPAPRGPSPDRLKIHGHSPVFDVIFSQLSFIAALCGIVDFSGGGGLTTGSGRSADR